MLKKFWKQTIIVALVAIGSTVFAQGLSITIRMKAVTVNVDDRTVLGNAFFWKPVLPALFTPAKTGIVCIEKRELSFAPPFE